MKIKVILAFFIFSLGLFYLSLIQYTRAEGVQTAPFNVFYGITGSNDTSIDLLKCLDKKSIHYAFSTYQSPLTDRRKLTKECLEEWLYQEVENRRKQPIKY